MNYEQFKSAILKRIEELLGPETNVQLHTIHKNNGLKLDGLVITDTGSNLSPTIFLNYYYEKQAVSFDIEAICRDILLTYEKNRAKEPVNIDFFTDYTILRSHICYRVINYEKNKELLETVPYIRYLDLAIVFYCLLNISKTGNATILIHTSHLKLWNVTVEQLYEQACRTTPELLPYDFRNMTSVLAELLPFMTPTEPDTYDVSCFCPMYVLTNTSKVYGACCILYPGLLESISEKLNYDLLILPVSIHEIILLPAVTRSYYKELAPLVFEINQTELAADEILSNHIYYYSRASQSLSICGC